MRIRRRKADVLVESRDAAPPVSKFGVPRREPIPIAAELAVGVAAGAAVGAIAGPVGAITGAAIGAAAGAIAGVALEKDEAVRAWREEQLDRDIGVIGGDIGEALPHPGGAEIGAPHAASVGAGRAHEQPTPSGGPIQRLG